MITTTEPLPSRPLVRVIGLGWQCRFWFLASFAVSGISAATFGFLLVAIDRRVRAWSAVQSALDQHGMAQPEDLARAQVLRCVRTVSVGCTLPDRAGVVA